MTAASTKAGDLAMVLRGYLAAVLNRYKRLHLYGKVFVWCLFAFYVALGVFVIVVTPARIAQAGYDAANALAATRFGWLAVAAAIVAVSFPPMVGHSTLATLCGFAYGMKGFAIASIASLVGSTLVFVVLRVLFARRLHEWSKGNPKWQALEAVVTAKGLPLMLLLRASPFPPWVYSNALFASISSVALWQFFVATFLTFPKMLLHVFIGARIAALSDGDTREKMDTQTKILNGVLIGGGIIIGITASWIIYTLVQRHIRKMGEFPPEVDELAAEAVEDYADEEAPLLRSLSPQPRNNTDL